MKRVLFVCVENAGRSQMAEGFFRKYLPKGFESISAGTKPSGKPNGNSGNERSWHRHLQTKSKINL